MRNNLLDELDRRLRRACPHLRPLRRGHGAALPRTRGLSRLPRRRPVRELLEGHRRSSPRPPRSCGRSSCGRPAPSRPSPRAWTSRLHRCATEWSSRSSDRLWSSSRATRRPRGSGRDWRRCRALLDGVETLGVALVFLVRPGCGRVMAVCFSGESECPIVLPAATRRPSPSYRCREATSSFGRATPRIPSSSSAPGKSSCSAAARRTAGWPCSAAGDLCGEDSAFEGQVRAYDARAVTSATLLRVTAALFLDLVRVRPELAGVVISWTAARLLQARAASLAMAMPSGRGATRTARGPAARFVHVESGLQFPLPDASDAVVGRADKKFKPDVELSVGRCPSFPQPPSRRHQAGGERLSGGRGTARGQRHVPQRDASESGRRGTDQGG